MKTVLLDVEELGKAAENCLIPKSSRKVGSAVVVIVHLGEGLITQVETQNG